MPWDGSHAGVGGLRWGSGSGGIRCVGTAPGSALLGLPGSITLSALPSIAFLLGGVRRSTPSGAYNHLHSSRRCTDAVPIPWMNKGILCEVAGSTEPTELTRGRARLDTHIYLVSLSVLFLNYSTSVHGNIPQPRVQQKAKSISTGSSRWFHMIRPQASSQLGREDPTRLC